MPCNSEWAMTKLWTVALKFTRIAIDVLLGYIDYDLKLDLCDPEKHLI